MKIDWGTVVVGLAILVVYGRMALIRGRKRRLERQALLEQKREAKKQKNRPHTPVAQPEPGIKITYQVISWWLVGGGLIITLVGIAMRYSTLFPVTLQPYWWVVTAAGILVFAFSFK